MARDAWRLADRHVDRSPTVANIVNLVRLTSRRRPSQVSLCTRSLCKKRRWKPLCQKSARSWNCASFPVLYWFMTATRAIAYTAGKRLFKHNPPPHSHERGVPNFQLDLPKSVISALFYKCFAYLFTSLGPSWRLLTDYHQCKQKQDKYKPWMV